MKLVATRWICDQTPEGATFEVPETDARILVAMGLARPDVAEKPTDRRRYRRRDLTAEGSA